MSKNGDPAWSNRIFLWVVIASIFGALYLVNDTYIMHNVIMAEDSFVAVSAYLILGGWVGTVCTLVYNAIWGKWLDPDYPGFSLGTPKMQGFALVCGAIAAGSTAFALAGSRQLDPSLVTAFANLALVYLAMYDLFIGKVKLNRILVPLLLVVMGSVLASVTKLAGGFAFTLGGILLLLVGRCLTDAIEKILRQRGVWNSDAVTFNFWRFLWLTVCGTILAATVAYLRGNLSELTTLIQTVWLSALPWILLTMFCVFFFNTLLQKAMKSGAVSKVSMVANLQIVFGIPLTLLANWFWPGVFGDLPGEVLVWATRALGVVLIIWGVSKLRGRAGEEES